MFPARTPSAAILLGLACITSQSQQPVPLSPTLGRSDGLNVPSSIAFTRLYLTAATEPAATTFDLANPTLTVQCTKRPNGKLYFELFVNYGAVTDAAYYPPWHRTNDYELFAPPTLKQSLTMEFLGYTQVKPVHRQFEFVAQPTGQLRYNSPSSGSSNMEEIAFYLQYLKALPTLRLSYAGHTATFQTEPLLAQIRKEPLCRASGL